MRARAWSVALAALLVLPACGGDPAATAASPPGDAPVVVRLGYFPNVTHAPALAGLAEGFFEDALGSGATLETRTFNAGPEVVGAIFSDGLDLAYIGPNPAINGYGRSGGAALRIVAGATSGGAALVVREGIRSADDLRGTVLSTPQLGNTQDVALRTWLRESGVRTELTGGGELEIRPQQNPQILETFRTGRIDGAWVPEPWATRLVEEGDGTVLVDEAELWPGGHFVTTQVIARAGFLGRHPDMVEDFLGGHVTAVEFVNDRPDEAKAVVNDAIEALTGSRLADATLDGAWARLTFTVDPIAASLRRVAEDATAAGLLEAFDLDGIYALDPLNAVLRARGREEVGE